MLNKIETIAFIKSDVEKKESANGKTLHKFRVCSKQKDQYITYQVTLWGNRFDALLPYLEKDKCLYIEGDLQKPKAYLNKEEVPCVMLEMYATRIELLPRGSKQIPETPKTEKELPIQEELPF